MKTSLLLKATLVSAAIGLAVPAVAFADEKAADKDKDAAGTKAPKKKKPAKKRGEATSEPGSSGDW